MDHKISYQSKDLQETRAWFEVGGIKSNLRIRNIILYSLKWVIIRMVSRVSVSKHLLIRRKKFWVFLSLFYLRMNICVIRLFWHRVPIRGPGNKKVWNIFQTKIGRKKSFSDKWPKTSTHHLFIRSCFHKSQICFTKFAACFDPLKTDFCLRIKIFK